MTGKRVYFKCPDCEKVNYFEPGQRVSCKRCGHDPADAPPRTAPAGEQIIVVQQQQQMGSDNDGIGIAALAIAIMALFTAPFLPFAWLLGITAIVLGVMAVVQSPEDSRSGLGIAGIVIGFAALIVATTFVAAPMAVEGSSGSAEGGSSGGNSGGGSSGSGGGSSGGSSGGGSSGGSSGGGGSGGGGGGDVGSPGAGWLAIPAALLLARRLR